MNPIKRIRTISSLMIVTAEMVLVLHLSSPAARIRSIKLDYYQSPAVRSCTREARLLLPGLKILADDDGRLPYDLRAIRCLLFMSDDDVTDEVIAGWLDELAAVGALIIYGVNGGLYVQIDTDSVFWDERISHPSPSKLPAIPEDSGGLPNHSGGLPSGVDRKGVERNGEESPPEDSREESGKEAPKEEEGEPTPSEPKYGEEHEAYKIARHLRRRLLEWNPTLKPLPSDETPERLEAWATEIDRAIRIDKRDPKKLMKMIDWLHDTEKPSSDGFQWRDVILSAPTLREKYSKVEIAKGRTSSNGKKSALDKPGLETGKGKDVW